MIHMIIVLFTQGTLLEAFWRLPVLCGVYRLESSNETLAKPVYTVWIIFCMATDTARLSCNLTG